MKKRYLSLLLAVVMLVSVFAGCGNTSKPSEVEQSKEEVSTAAPEESEETESKEETSEPEEAATGSGGTIIVGDYILDTQMSAINPFLKENTAANMLTLVYEPLMFFNQLSGELEEKIATSYEWNDDFTAVTFVIRDDAKWHDGEAVTPEDVVYTYELLKEEPILDKYALWEKIDSVTADGNNVEFKLSQSFTSLPFYTSEIYIVPKHIWEKEPSAAEALNNSPVGSGPFVYNTYNTGTDIQFDAFKDHWAGAPKADALIIQMYNSAPNLTLALLKGDIACSFGTIAMSSIPELLTKEGAEMQVYAGLNNFSVIMNHENELLADVSVRKAMSMAINQQDLITKGEYDGVFPSSPGWLPELFGEFQSEEAKNSHVYDPEAAMELLEEAGYTKGSDDIYQKDGKRLSFTYHNASGAPAQQMEAGLMQQWLLNIGIEIIPRLATWPELTQLLQRGEFDLLQNGISFPPDPYAALNNVFNSSMTAPTGETTPGYNYFRYRNDEVDALLAEVSTETDVAKQTELYHKIQDIVAEDVVFLPMYNVGGHIPYYDGVKYVGWIEDGPVASARGLSQVYVK